MDKIIQIPLDHLQESPFNPRKAYSEPGLQELANSIKSQGIMQPIVVRGLPHSLNFEIIFGHRRYRASWMAGLHTIPCIVNQMTDQEAATAQLHENLEREDVSPVEEAEAYKRLMTEHAVTAEALMAQTGKSKSYIYGRLKLTKLCIEVRNACTAGLPTDVALKIARIHPPSLQVKALAKMRNADDTWLSVRQGLQVLDGMRHTIPLISADFDASVGPCVACQYRSDNDPDLLIALGAGVCTYSSCFDDMSMEYHQSRFEAHVLSGKPMLSGEAAQAALARSRWPVAADPHRSHVDISMHVAYADSPISDILKSMGTEAPEITLALDGRGKCIELLEMRHLVALRAFLGVDAAPVAAPLNYSVGYQNDEDDEGYSQKPDSPTLTALPHTPEEMATGQNWGAISLAIMHQAAQASRTTDDLRLICGSLIDQLQELPKDVIAAMGWSGDIPAEALKHYRDDTDWAFKQLPGMSADQLAKLAVVIAIDGGPYCIDYKDCPAARVALAKRFGVDPLNPSPADPPAAAAEPGRVIRYSNPVPNHELDLNTEPADQDSEVQP